MPSTVGIEALHEHVAEVFAREYGGEPTVWVRSPGRVNLIGEHTDYNDGFVLPIAIERQVIVGARGREAATEVAAGGLAAGRPPTRTQDPPAQAGDQPQAHQARFQPPASVRIYSVTLGGRDAFSPRRLRHAQGWRDYARGVVWALREAGYAIPTVDMALASDVPLGAGLSSSAALEVGLGWTLAQIGGLDLDRVRLAKLMQRAENGWVGVQSGIMDQFIAALGQADHALLVDTRDLSYRAVPLPQGVNVVIADTGVKRGLVESEYNARREETASAARLLGERSLRDVQWDGFEARASGLPGLLRRRARHVVGENERVLATVRLLEAGDVAGVGRLMDASHASLRDDYAVSHPNLDLLVSLARRVPGVYGARMTGAGFGGATVSLVADSAVQDFLREVGPAYQAQTGLEPTIYVTRATDGVNVMRDA